MGCEPTYEELKPFFSKSVNSNSYLLRAYLWGIETYSNRFQKTFSEYVASLPMRNWNRRLYLNVPSTLKLRAYLWGIETFANYRAHRRTIKVASLPMRNWNLNISIYSINCSSGCEPTYEELKHPTTIKTPSSNKPLRAYLWGIETLYCLSRSSMLCQVASLPMRNWNLI